MAGRKGSGDKKGEQSFQVGGCGEENYRLVIRESPKDKLEDCDPGLKGVCKARLRIQEQRYDMNKKVHPLLWRPGHEEGGAQEF